MPNGVDHDPVRFVGPVPLRDRGPDDSATDGVREGEEGEEGVFNAFMFPPSTQQQQTSTQQSNQSNLTITRNELRQTRKASTFAGTQAEQVKQTIGH